MEPTIYIGYDSREAIVYDVCKFSIEKRASRPVNIQPIDVTKLRRRGLYWRDKDPLSSTEFTYSRYLAPYLNNFTGCAMFVDCDFLFLADVWELLDQFDPDKALQCVQHDYKPTETTKMDGRHQSVYPRKNWSSLMFMNAGHPSNQVLTPELVNTETGKYLHRFEWLKDEELGELPHLWNYLDGWYPDDEPNVKAWHMTLGSPNFPEYQNIACAPLWREEYKEMTGKAFQI